MSALKMEITGRTYAVQVPVDRFLATLHDEPFDRPTLLDKLALLDAVDIQYNGHFGSYVFFRLQDEDDSPERQEMILNTIAEHLACQD